ATDKQMADIQAAADREAAVSTVSADAATEAAPVEEPDVNMEEVLGEGVRKQPVTADTEPEAEEAHAAESQTL
ncbi:MAG TPA: hypothetical protein VII81_00290, partial [Terriglobales bacterium]